MRLSPCRGVKPLRPPDSLERRGLRLRRERKAQRRHDRRADPDRRPGRPRRQGHQDQGHHHADRRRLGPTADPLRQRLWPGAGVVAAGAPDTIRREGLASSPWIQRCHEQSRDLRPGTCRGSAGWVCGTPLRSTSPFCLATRGDCRSPAKLATGVGYRHPRPTFPSAGAGAARNSAALPPHSLRADPGLEVRLQGELQADMLGAQGSAQRLRRHGRQFDPRGVGQDTGGAGGLPELEHGARQAAG